MRRPPKVNPGMACVAYDVSADGVGSVSEELVGFSHNLVGYDGYCVEGSCQSDELMHVLIQFLLSGRKHFPPDVLAPEMCRERVDDNYFYVVGFYDFVRVLEEEHLVVCRD